MPRFDCLASALGEPCNSAGRNHRIVGEGVIVQWQLVASLLEDVGVVALGERYQPRQRHTQDATVAVRVDLSIAAAVGVAFDGGAVRFACVASSDDTAAIDASPMGHD